MSYHVDRFFGAVSVLVTHGPVKQRLMQAYEQYLEQMDTDELPLELQEPFAELQRRMHGVAPLNGEGAVCASVRKMSKDQADECACMIVALARQIANAEETQQANLPLTADEPTYVPPFLVKSG